MRPRNAYKDMLDNVVSPIACVSMNHQNQLEQMANEAMFAIRWNQIEKKSTKTNSDVSTLLPHLNSNTDMDIHIYILADINFR
jgi:hypothetical protein